MSKENKVKYILRQADNTLVLGHRLSEWCGHGPILEQDIAMTNISLDLIGHCRLYFQYAADLLDDGRDEDDLAFLRNSRQYYNVLLVERPNGHWGHTIMRQMIYDSFHYLYLKELLNSSDERMAAIAEKSIKEVEYHANYSKEWVKRLSLGTDVGHKKMQDALNDLYHYVDELVTADAIDIEAAEKGYGVDLDVIRKPFHDRIHGLLEECGLAIPEVKHMQQGGKNGTHTEHLGHLLSELQYMQRTYPGLEW